MFNKIFNFNKSINLNDGIDRRLKNLIDDDYGFEQDYADKKIGGILNLKLKSKKLAIIDPNLVCDYFNEESVEKDIIHLNGVVISQHGCSGLLFKYKDSYRLFNFGFDQRGNTIYFDDEIIQPVQKK